MRKVNEGLARGLLKARAGGDKEFVGKIMSAFLELKWFGLTKRKKRMKREVQA